MVSKRHTSFLASSTSTPLSAKTFKGFWHETHLHSDPHCPFTLKQPQILFLQPDVHEQDVGPLLLVEELGDFDFLDLLGAKIRIKAILPTDMICRFFPTE